jgi:acyl-CoA synthetase (AMP-forming)/AMP-acid ligase II
MITVAQSIERAARHFADRTAVVDGDRSLTFAETNRRANKLANALVALSPVSGGRVSLLMNNRLEYVESDFGIVKAGKVRVAINPRLVDHERLHILDDAAVETLIFDSSFAEFATSAATTLPHLANLIAIGDPVRGALSYEDVLAGASDAALNLPRGAADPNYIMYTSGTSGRPKGATVSDAGRIAGAVNMLIDELDPQPGDAMLHVGSMCHGSGSKVLAYFLRGARNITLPKFEPESFFDTVLKEGVTGTFVVPTMIGMLLEASAGHNVDTGRLRNVTYGGAPITPTRLREAHEAFGNIFVQVYGSCEAPHPVTVLNRPDHLAALAGDSERLTTVGRESTLVETRLVTEDGSDAADDEPGELWVRGPNVMTGYWENPDATEAVFDDGWYKSGDVAVRDEDGFYYIVDRLRDVVISGGLNVYPAEVEAAIGKHPAVRDVAVIGVPDDRWGESVKAIVVLKAGATLDSNDLAVFCGDNLAGYKKPQSFDFVAELPIGSTGKVLKRELGKQYWAGKDRRVN